MAQWTPWGVLIFINIKMYFNDMSHLYVTSLHGVIQYLTQQINSLQEPQTLQVWPLQWLLQGTFPGFVAQGAQG